VKRNWLIGLAILVVVVGYFVMQQKPAPEAPKETPKQEAPAPKPAEAPKAEEKPAEAPNACRGAQDRGKTR
jgi:hypothetical protein